MLHIDALVPGTYQTHILEGKNQKSIGFGRSWYYIICSVFTLPLACTASIDHHTRVFFFKEAEVRGTAGTSRQDSRESRSEVHEILHEIRWNFNNGAAQAVRLHLIINGETCM